MRRTWKLHGHVFDLTWLGRFYRREILDVTQTKFGREHGISQSRISEHERGRFNASVHNALIDEGLITWADRMSERKADVLAQLYSGKWGEERLK